LIVDRRVDYLQTLFLKKGYFDKKSKNQRLIFRFWPASSLAGRPNCVPLRLARAIPSSHRFLIKPRSNSAMRRGMDIVGSFPPQTHWGMSARPQKITFAEMRESGVTAVLIYCSTSDAAIRSKCWPTAGPTMSG
jgi:hypothetical protein